MSKLSSIGQKFLSILTPSSVNQKALENKIKEKITTVNYKTNLFLSQTVDFVDGLSTKNWRDGLEEFKQKKKAIEDKIRDRYLSYQELNELINNKSSSQAFKDHCFDRIWRGSTQVAIFEQWIILSETFFTFGSKASHKPNMRDKNLESQLSAIIKKIFLIIFIADYKLNSPGAEQYDKVLSIIGELLGSLQIQLQKLPEALNKNQKSEMEFFITACFLSCKSVREREPLTKIPEEFKLIQQKAIQLLKLYNSYPTITCSFYSNTDVFFYTAEKKDFVSIVFPSPEAKDYAIQILGGDSLAFSQTGLIELKTVFPKIILHKTKAEVQYLQTFDDKPDTLQGRALCIPVYVENDKFFIVCKNRIFSDKFKEVFLSNNQMLIEAESVNENLLRISNVDFANNQKIIRLNTRLCLREANIYSFLRHLPKEQISLISKYAHECETESADDGCGHKVLPPYYGPNLRLTCCLNTKHFRSTAQPSTKRSAIFAVFAQ